MTAIDLQPLSPAQSPAVIAAKIQPGRWLGTLLYGRNVDRTAKARARVGLAILAFAAVYSIIAVRLVMFAVGRTSATTVTFTTAEVAVPPELSMATARRA